MAKNDKAAPDTQQEKPAAPRTAPKFKVTNIQTHVGVTLKANGAGMVKTGVHAEKEKMTLDLHPCGVVLRQGDAKDGKLVPFSNIQAIDVEFED